MIGRIHACAVAERVPPTDAVHHRGAHGVAQLRKRHGLLRYRRHGRIGIARRLEVEHDAPQPPALGEAHACFVGASTEHQHGSVALKSCGCAGAVDDLDGPLLAEVVEVARGSVGTCAQLGVHTGTGLPQHSHRFGVSGRITPGEEQAVSEPAVADEAHHLAVVAHRSVAEQPPTPGGRGE